MPAEPRTLPLLLLAIPLGIVLSFSGQDARSLTLRETPVAEASSLAAQVDSRLAFLQAEAGIAPSELVDDLTYARRLYLDLLGSPPSLAELRALEASEPAGRRARILQRVFADERFAEVLGERLARIAVGDRDAKKGDLIYRRGRLVSWLSAQVRKNRPYDELVRELLTAEGLSTDTPAVNFAVSQDTDPTKLAARTTRAFLGIRIDCAQCHDHPFTRWKQRDFEGLAAFFARVEQNVGGVREGKEGELRFQLPTDLGAMGMGMGMSEGETESALPNDEVHEPYARKDGAKEDGAEESGTTESDGEPLVKAPLGQPVLLPAGKKAKPGQKIRTVQPRVPFQPELLPSDEPVRRRALAAWVTAEQNPYFARAVVNRLWQWLMGRGLVEPIDELDTSLPRDEVLLELLASDFRAHGYDLQHLIRAIVSTRAYQRSTARAEAWPETQSNRDAIEAWALRPLKPLRADQLGRAVQQSGSFWPYTSKRAPLLRLAVWGGLNDFTARHADDLGQEEPEEETLLQRLHLLNGKTVSEVTKPELFNPSGRLPLLAPDDTTALDAAFLMTLTRRPNADERAYFGRRLAEAKGHDERSAVMADLHWALLNCTEFAWQR